MEGASSPSASLINFAGILSTPAALFTIAQKVSLRYLYNLHQLNHYTSLNVNPNYEVPGSISRSCQGI